MDTINLTDREKELLIEQLERDLVQLDKDLEEIEKKKSETANLIRKLRSFQSANNPKRQSLLKGHDFTWKSISLKILSETREFLTTDGVYKYFIGIHPEFKAEDPKNVQASLSGALSQLSKSRQVVRIEKKFGKGNYWGLPNWFYPDGRVYDDLKDQLVRMGMSDFTYQPTKS